MFYLEEITPEKENEILDAIEDWKVFINYIVGYLKEDDEFDYRLFVWDEKIIDKEYNFLACYDDDDDDKSLQGICAYHAEDDIFFLDYVATAPWNYFKIFKEDRFSYLFDFYDDYKKLVRKGVGSFILSILIKNFEDEDNYKYFKLFSVPGALRFYNSKKDVLVLGSLQANGLQEYFIEKITY